MPVPSSRVSETVGKHRGNPRQVRISRKVRNAVRLMVEQAMSRKDAAEASDLKDDSLYVALKKPEVISFRDEVMADLRRSEAARALGRVAHLAHTSQSDHVRLESSKFLLGIEGISPSEHVVHDHTHKIVPGYVLDPAGPDMRRPDHLRDVTPPAPVIADHSTQGMEGAEISASVPHAAEGNGRRPQHVGGTASDSEGD